MVFPACAAINWKIFLSTDRIIIYAITETPTKLSLEFVGALVSFNVTLCGESLRFYYLYILHKLNA